MIKKAFLILILSFLIYKGFFLSLKLGFFRHVFNHHPKNCHFIPEIIEGSEDIQTIPGGKAFVSSGYNGGKDDKGSIYLLDLKKLQQGEYKATKLQIKSKDGRTDLPYSSHGLSAWVHPSTGMVYLYAINHHGGRETVEKLRYNEEEGVLVQEKTFSSSSFHVTNDLHVIEEDKFYFTNWVYTKSPYEVLLDFHWGSVGLYDDRLEAQDKGKLIATGLNTPNGIIATDKYLFVAECGSESILVYSIGPQHSITFLKSMKVNIAVDNLSLDPVSHDIILAGHPIAYKTFLYLDKKIASAPSMVLRQKLGYKEDGALEIGKMEVLYSDDGDMLSTSSVGQVVDGDGLLVGSVRHKLVYCSM